MILCAILSSLCTLSAKKMQFSYARVFRERKRKQRTHRRTYYERNFFFQRALPLYKYLTVFGTYKTTGYPANIAERMFPCGIAMRSYPDKMKADRLSIRLFLVYLYCSTSLIIILILLAFTFKILNNVRNNNIRKICKIFICKKVYFSKT